MNKIIAFTFTAMVAVICPAYAMNNYDDPRILLSYMDKSLVPELDILRVTTNATADNKLVFQVKTRGERQGGDTGDYVLLHIMHGKSYIFIVPVDTAQASQILIYESIPAASLNAASRLSREFKKVNMQPNFSVERVRHGVEFSIPIDWIDFSNDFGYDAYTVRVSKQSQAINIDHVYDQAAKGRKEEKRYSAITLLNKLCAARRQL